MTVYVVIHHGDHETSEILGVFATRAAAEAAKKKRSNYRKYDARTVDVPDDAPEEKWDDRAWKARSRAEQWADAGIETWRVQGGGAR